MECRVRWLEPERFHLGSVSMGTLIACSLSLCADAFAFDFASDGVAGGIQLVSTFAGFTAASVAGLELVRAKAANQFRNTSARLCVIGLLMGVALLAAPKCSFADAVMVCGSGATSITQTIDGVTHAADKARAPRAAARSSAALHAARPVLDCACF